MSSDESDDDDYFDRMVAAAPSDDLPFDENNRVLYFFPQEDALDLGGEPDSVLVGLASKNGKFERLSSVGVPDDGEIKTKEYTEQECKNLIDQIIEYFEEVKP